MQLTCLVVLDARNRPGKAPYDPRFLCAGSTNDSGQWVSGMFDRNSWFEVLGGWARSVVAGRARLGGIPCGVIAVETRTIEQIIPADPASPDSKEQILQRAGQVWYPDSAYKTAQAIKDMDAEDMPLFIFANWRGFSGGMTDMFDEVLKYGSYIVDALRCYKQPVFVYLPPNGRLQGGAWVVVDSTINEQFMEMYSDDDTRGGVLEPEATVEVKYRHEEIIATAHRLDSQLIALDAELAVVRQYLAAHGLPTVEEKKREALAKKKKSSSEEQSVPYSPDGTAPAPTAKSTDSKAKSPPGSNNPRAAASGADDKSGSSLPSTTASDVKAPARSEEQVLADIKAREKLLSPVYHQVATAFADLHDTPGRMTAKGVVRRIVSWEQSRVFFYWRLRRRLAECAIVKRLRDADPTTYGGAFGWKAAIALIRSWLEPSTAVVATKPSAKPVVSAGSVTAATPNSAGGLDDRAFVEAVQKMSSVIDGKVSEIGKAHATRQVRALVDSNSSGVVSGLVDVISKLDAKSLQSLKAALNLK